jgi:peptidoglycan hydrolase CwlO-like protein
MANMEETKDEKIARLEHELKCADATITTLTEQVSTLTAQISTLTAQNEAQARDLEELRGEVREAWRVLMARSVRVALTDSDHHRRSMLTGRCVP